MPIVGPPIGPVGFPFAFMRPQPSYAAPPVAAATVALLILELEPFHAHLLHHDPVYITTEVALAFVTAILALVLIVREWRQHT